jgi:hypothetical protein
MGMADPLPETMSLTIHLDRSHDAYLTCLVCNREGVDYEFTFRTGRGSRVTTGIHYDCAKLVGKASS